MNSGLYLVLLLHLYEQRFAELMTLNYSRASRERPSSPSGPSNSRSPTAWAPTAEGPYSGLSPPRVE
ncbi:hypothetical protein U0070_019680 [Myodes glareolus]|uniref:RING-type E3 ubiquitin transferase n=1 Tax=Myodes glareolus TaxID=447135 RepID=A0AAW0I2M1_MYOGA